MLLSLLVGFTSCEDDETIFDRIVGRTWIGDLGFESDRHHDPLESGIYLGVDGFGEDQLCYYDNGEYYGKPLRLQWSVGMVPFILIMVMLLLRVNCVMYMLVMDV